MSCKDNTKKQTDWSVLNHPLCPPLDVTDFAKGCSQDIKERSTFFRGVVEDGKLFKDGKLVGENVEIEGDKITYNAISDNRFINGQEMEMYFFNEGDTSGLAE